MTALSAPFLNTKIDPQSVIPHLLPGGLPVAASTKIYANSIVAVNSSGYAVPASADTTLRVVGRARAAYDNSSGAAGAITAEVEIGTFDYNIDSGAGAVTSADVGSAVYAKDDNTISRGNGGNTYPVAGFLMNVFTPPNSTSARAVVLVGFAADGVVARTRPFYARAVMTSQASMNAYTGSGTGTLTAGANGAMGAQDGVTLAAGDVVILPAVVTGATITAADVGPWVVSSLGGASAKIVLTRPDWWPTGGGIPQAQSIDVGGEGTIWAGIAWKSLAAKGAIIGTTDPALYPRVHKGTGAVGTQVTAVFAATAAVPTAVDETAAAAVKAVLVAGYGTGTLTFTGTGTDAIGWTVTNF